MLTGFLSSLVYLVRELLIWSLHCHVFIFIFIIVKEVYITQESETKTRRESILREVPTVSEEPKTREDFLKCEFIGLFTEQKNQPTCNIFSTNLAGLLASHTRLVFQQAHYSYLQVELNNLKIPSDCDYFDWCCNCNMICNIRRNDWIQSKTDENY